MDEQREQISNPLKVADVFNKYYIGDKTIVCGSNE